MKNYTLRQLLTLQFLVDKHKAGESWDKKEVAEMLQKQKLLNECGSRSAETSALTTMKSVVDEAQKKTGATVEQYNLPRREEGDGKMARGRSPVAYRFVQEETIEA